MDPVSLIIAATLASAQPQVKDLNDARTPIRCRPAPYYIAEHSGRQVPRMLLDTPKGRSITVLDKRGRPCHLTRTPNEGRTTFRNADD